MQAVFAESINDVVSVAFAVAAAVPFSSTGLGETAGAKPGATESILNGPASMLAAVLPALSVTVPDAILTALPAESARAVQERRRALTFVETV